MDEPYTVAAWELWWSDPAAGQWTEADRAAVTALARLHVKFEQNAAEIRLRSDGLGLTQKGKRDLRWKVAESDTESKPAQKTPGLRKLKAV